MTKLLKTREDRERNLREVFTRDLRHWRRYGGGSRRHPVGRPTYDRELPEGIYKIEPVNSWSGWDGSGFLLTFTATGKRPRGDHPSNYYLLDVHASPEEAAIAAAKHYAESF